MVKPTPDERRAKREQLEAEFIDNVQQILGFPLMAWQKPILLEARRASLEGRSFDIKKALDESPDRPTNSMPKFKKGYW